MYTATTEIYTSFPTRRSSDLAARGLFDWLRTQDADVICLQDIRVTVPELEQDPYWIDGDRKSTRLNSSHVRISYAVFCLKKKKYSSCCPLLAILALPLLSPHL